MFNPVIILAIIVQSLIAKASRTAGSIFGFLLTTGILIWGISLYTDGDQIAFFGHAISQEFFFLICVVWYGFDVRELLAARKETSELTVVIQSPLLQEDSVKNFYQTTVDAWAAGTLYQLNRAFKKEGRLPLDDFMRKYPPAEGTALNIFFKKFGPLENEFLIGIGNLETGKNRAWFVLTNLRMIQKDGMDNEFKAVTLSEIENFETKGVMSKTLTIQMKSGETRTFSNVQIHPAEKYLSAAISPGFTA